MIQLARFDCCKNRLLQYLHPTFILTVNFYNMKYRKNGHAEGVFFNSFIDHADYLYFDELYIF